MKKVSGKRPTRSAATPAVPRAGGRTRALPAGADHMAPEYDFRGARPKPYAARYAAGATAVVLDPDVAAAFPSAARVNEVLRAVAGILGAPTAPTPKRSRRRA